VPDPTGRERLIDRGRIELLEARTRTLAGSPQGAVALDVFLFVDPLGRVSEVTLVRPGMEKALSEVKARLKGLSLGLTWADGPGHPHVRRASIACSSASPCVLVLDTLDRVPTAPVVELH
jgi:hypothetical protein